MARPLRIFRALVAPVLLACVISLTAALGQNAAEPVVLTIEGPQTAQISGFRKMWDTPQPGLLVFDAVHRSLLVRFPRAAERIAWQIRKGYAVQKAELVLPFDAAELWPDVGYNNRLSFGNDELFRRLQPQWHAVAWALRRPWEADAERGPTFNAFIAGAGYWARYGAQDPEKDRFPQQFGPTEVSYVQTEGRMDVTAALTDPAFGRSLGERLRGVEECGFLLRKWEVYDFRFRKAGDGAYEWGVSCGGRGIIIKPPSLCVTLAPVASPGARVVLPAARNIAGLAKHLTATGQGGRPTTVMPSSEELRQIIEQYRLKQPAWMPDWQWRHVQELDALGGGTRIPDTLEGYGQWIDGMLADPPRYWNGWDVPDRLLIWYLYADALPAYVRDHWLTYWTAWLMPDRPTDQLEHPQAVELFHNGENKYYNDTGDWRGNASFYRDGYCYQISTMNFNHTAAMGALLGGNIIGSQFAMEDGRHGLEHFPLRLWAWFDGSTQESIDHYYFAITLSDQKMFADFGPTHLDRMMGTSMLAKSVEELTSAYHPGLRHFISSSSRTGPAYLFVIQEGLQHILHTLSRSGALHDVGNPDTHGMPVVGHDCPPGRIAQQAAITPWAPEWVANMVDEKPVPYEMTNSYKMWGGFQATPLWRRTYLGRHYGMASLDVAIQNETVPAMAQWRREDKQVERIQDLGTLLVRYGINNTNLLASSGGSVGTQGGTTATLQHRNKMIVLASPVPRLEYPYNPPPEEVRSLQTTIGLFDFQPAPTWELHVGGERVTQLPFGLKGGDVITLRDGVTYLGIIPVPATDLGRTAEVVISEGGPEVDLQGGGKARPALLIESFNLRSETPLDKQTADWEAIDIAYNGFVIEIGDVTEYGSFEAFQRHMAQAALQTRWEPAENTLHLTYTSGQDTLELGYKPDYTGSWNVATPTDQCFAYRRVNGQWPYLAPGMDRDTTLTQQGTTGHLEKNGATLTCEPGRMAYLQTEPISGTYAGFNPLPDPTAWSMAVPGGVTIGADGKVGLLRVIVRPSENRLWVDYAAKPDQNAEEMATALVVFGFARAPAVERNGQPCGERFESVEVGGRRAFVIPLSDQPSGRSVEQVVRAYRQTQGLLPITDSPARAEP
jgi:hypothetical protein